MPDAELVLELLSRPDDLELRLVIADRLQDAGDPRGQLIAVQCALEAARAPGERARLRECERALVRCATPELDPEQVKLEWRLGFVVAATVLDRPRALVPALLAHPAARLIEELLEVAVEPPDLVTLGPLIEARPRPSRLRRITVGTPGPGRRWIERAIDPAWLAAIAVAAPDLEIRPATHVSQAELEAQIEGDTAPHPIDSCVWQIAPPAEQWTDAVLRVREGCEEALAAVHAGLGDQVQLVLPYDARAGQVRVREASCHVGYANLYRAIRALAPLVEDVRFTICSYSGNPVDEYAIIDGALWFRRGFAASGFLNHWIDYWYGQVFDRPRDEALRRMVLRLYLYLAKEEEEYLALRVRNEHAPYRRYEDARRVLDRLVSLDDRDPQIWRLRERFFRAMGELEEAGRCLARAQELELPPGEDPDGGAHGDTP